jgi:hypothetical protein
MVVSKAGNGQPRGKRVQLHSISKSHRPPMLLVNPWHVTSKNRFRYSSTATPQFISSLDCKLSYKLNVSTKKYLTMKDKLFYNTYHQNRQKKRWYRVSTVIGEHDRSRQLQSKIDRISIRTLMIVSLRNMIKMGP